MVMNKTKEVKVFPADLPRSASVPLLIRSKNISRVPLCLFCCMSLFLWSRRRRRRYLFFIFLNWFQSQSQVFSAAFTPTYKIP